MRTGNKRGIVGGLLTVTLLLVGALLSGSLGNPVLAASGTETEEEFYSEAYWDATWLGNFHQSRLGKVPTHNPDGTLQYGPACTATTDSNCKVSALDVDEDSLARHSTSGSFGLKWTSVFPYCESATQMNCITGLTIKNSTTGATEEGQFLLGYAEGTFFPSSPFIGDLSRLIPDGGLAPYFSTTLFPDVFANSPWGFRVQVSLSGLSRQATCDSKAEKQSPFCTFSHPSQVPKSYNFLTQFKMSVAPCSIFANGSDSMNCVEESLPKDAEFSIRVRISSKLLPKGWLNGRVVRPGINQKVIADGFELEVSGAVAQVPSTEVRLTCADLTANKTAESQLNQHWYSGRSRKGLPQIATCADATSIAETPGASAGYDGVIERDRLGMGAGFFDPSIGEALDLFEAKNNKVGILGSEWSLNWLPIDVPWGSTTDSVCDSLGLVGVVGTTAALYGELPIFDPTTGQLTYQMVGPHYLADGSLNEGTLSLVMRRDYAICQWGIDPAPDTMLVKIANSNSSLGNQAIVNARVEGDFFRVDASGVTFSAPQMRVVAKVKKVSSTMSMRLKSGSSLPITKVVKNRKGYVASWYVMKGQCRITITDTKTLHMAKKGTCEILVTEFNKKSRTAKRTLLKLS